MKIQILLKVTGEDSNETKEILKKVIHSLKEANHEPYSSTLDSNQPKDKKSLFKYAFEKIKNTDAVLAIIKSNEKSEGMLMEIGCAIGNNKKFILAIKNDVLNNHLRELADKVIEFESMRELYDKLKTIK